MENLPKLRRADPVAIYNVWGHGYAILALVSMYQRHADDPARQQEIVDLLKTQYDYLDDTSRSMVVGATTTFVSDRESRPPIRPAFCRQPSWLPFTKHVRSVLLLQTRLTQRAIGSIHRQQKPDFSYLYGEYLKYQPMRGINRPGGSLGRSQACNLALRLWGDERITDEVLSNVA